MKADPRKYCERVCVKLCHYLSQLQLTDVLEMDVDFFQDDNGRLWLFYAKKIVVRKRQPVAVTQVKGDAEKAEE